MNMRVNDKILSLAPRPNTSQESKTSTVSSENEKSDQTTLQKKGDDNLNLSAAGQLLQYSATAPTDEARAFPETEEQANALVARIRQQFEQSGSRALDAHSAVQDNRIDLLLRSVPI